MRKNKGKRFGTLMLSLCVSAVIFAAGSLQTFAYTETTGTVSQDNVKVRESASTTATQVSSLKIGDTIEIVDEATDASGYVWYKIRVNKSEYGYVRSDLVSKAGGSSSTTTTSSTTEANASAASLPATTVTSTDQRTATAVDNCKVRSGAGTGYDQVGNLTKGDTVTITGEATGSDSKTWYQISYGTSGKTGFVRSDLVNVTEAAPVEVQEVAEPAEGENPEGQEGAEGENAEVSEAEAPVQETAAQVGDGAFELKYEDDTWYLYDYEKEQRVQVRQLIEVAEQVPSLTKQAGTYKTVIIGLAIAIAALIIGIIILVLKLRDSLYYEDEDEDEEYDEFASNGRRNRSEDDEESPRSRRKLQEEDEEEEETPRRAFRKNISEDREHSKQPRQERNADDKPVRGASRRSSDEDRTVRPERNAEERPSRADRNSDDRQARHSRRDGNDERQDRRSEERASRRIRQAQEEEDRASKPSRRDNSADESPRRRAKNFIGDDDDFEFEFLDLDD